ITAAPATLIHARQPLPSLWATMRQLIRPGRRGQLWTLPDGAVAEQCGDRRTDVLVVWADGEETPSPRPSPARGEGDILGSPRPSPARGEGDILGSPRPSPARGEGDKPAAPSPRPSPARGEGDIL